MDPIYIRSAWTVLTSVARRREKITYGDLATQSGWRGIAQAVGMLLNPIYYDVCKPRKWPDLSAVAVSTATGEPQPRLVERPRPRRQPRCLACGTGAVLDVQLASTAPWFLKTA